VAVSQATLLIQASHAIPPITLMFSIEILISIVRSDLKREDRAAEIAEADPHVLSDVTPAVTRVGIVGHRGADRNGTSDQVLQFYRLHPDASYVTAASHLNIARQTVSQHVSRLMEEGRILRDGYRFVVHEHDGREFA